MVVSLLAIVALVLGVCLWLCAEASIVIGIANIAAMDRKSINFFILFFFYCSTLFCFLCPFDESRGTLVAKIRKKISEICVFL